LSHVDLPVSTLYTQPLHCITSLHSGTGHFLQVLVVIYRHKSSQQRHCGRSLLNQRPHTNYIIGLLLDGFESDIVEAFKEKHASSAMERQMQAAQGNDIVPTETDTPFVDPPTLETAEESALETGDGKCKLHTESPGIPSRKRTIWWLIGILTFATASVVAGVCASGKCGAKDKNPETFSPTFSPSQSPTSTSDLIVSRVVTSFFNNISFLEGNISARGTSPESRALAWLIRDDTLFNSSELLTLDSETDTEVAFRLRQRYPLLTLWFQQAGKMMCLTDPGPKPKDCWKTKMNACGRE
jgi:hypothetical protein